MDATVGGATGWRLLTFAAAPQVPAALFASQWRTTGTGSSVIRDGTPDRWTGALSATGGSVVTAGSAALADWPTANALRVPSAAGESACLIQRTDLAVQAIGESRFYRVYMDVRVPDDSSDAASHPFQDGNAASNTNWMVEIYHDTPVANTWRLSIWPGNGTQANPNYQRWTSLTNLTKGVTYRIEWQVRRTGAATMEIHVRVYNGAGVLVLGDADFVELDGAGSVSLANNPQLGIYDQNSIGTWLNAGCNQSGWTGAGTMYAYQGAVAVSGTDWLGAYNAATEANF